MDHHADVPRNRFRNTAFVIERTRGHFDAAYESGVMGLFGLSLHGRHVRLKSGPCDDAEITDFVRCSYLGLDNHPDITSGAISAIQEYGALHWSCARTRLNYDILGRLESELSELFKARVICFSNVMVANMGALPLIASGHLTDKKKPFVVFDRECHVSLQYHKANVADETEVTTIPHNDLNMLEDICRNQYPVAYIADGVYSMGGETPIRELQTLQEKYGLFLYIDDAHGISIFGRQGEGFARSQFPDELGERTIIAASLAKGFGASGGVVMLGTPEQENLFRRYAQSYTFTAAPNLAAVGAARASARLHGGPLLGDLQTKLAENIQLFDAALETPQCGNRLPIRLVPIGGEAQSIAAARNLLDQGYYTSATFFPTVARGRAALRICITATHSRSAISDLCEKVRHQRDRARPAAA
jgi:8-amino-7-oxononanoate synthase